MQTPKPHAGLGGEGGETLGRKADNARYPCLFHYPDYFHVVRLFSKFPRTFKQKKAKF